MSDFWWNATNLSQTTRPHLLRDLIHNIHFIFISKFWLLVIIHCDIFSKYLNVYIVAIHIRPMSKLGMSRQVYLSVFLLSLFKCTVLYLLF